MAKKSVKLYTDKVLETFYNNLLNGHVDNLHIPHSDVFYVRAACEAHYGAKFTLKHVEDAMIAEGWKERSYSDPNYETKVKSKRVR
tara:strand:- start:24 stop:281 length:258 start_codon:yes stop_codon:yes gene_type:complete